METWLVAALGVALVWTLLARLFARREDPEDGGPEEEPPWSGPDAPVEIPIGDSIDLHWFPPSDVGEIVDAYLEAAAARGFREVRIIHGRGRGVQRNRVRRHLERCPFVEAYDDAPGDRGGWGATLVRLRADEAASPPEAG